MKRNNNSVGVGGRIFAVIFGLPFLAVGIVMLWLAVSGLNKAHRVAGWQPVPCKITTLKLDRSSGSDSVTYRCMANYNYEFNGRQYTSDKVSLYNMHDNIGSFQQDCYRYLKNARDNNIAMCYVNPDNPSEAILIRDIRWGMVGFFALFVVAFGGAGGGIIFFALFGNRFQKNKYKAGDGGDVLAGNPEWQSGVIRSSDRKGIAFVVIFAIIWDLISIPAAYFGIVEGFSRHGNRLALLALAFPLIGTLLMLGAVYVVVRYLKYGRTEFQAAELPGVIGGKLGGVIRVPSQIAALDGFQVRLMCFHRYTTGSGDSRTTHDDLIWDDTLRLKSGLHSSRPDETLLPVLFAIPFDTRETTRGLVADRIIWKLEATARTKGVDFKTVFEVPVFRTEQSSADFVLDDSAIRPYLMEAGPDDVISRVGGYITRDGGDVSYYFPAARNKSMALSLTIFFAVFCGVSVALMAFSAPVVFPLVTGLITLLLLWGVVNLWLVTSRLELTHRTLTVKRGILGFGLSKIVARKNVADVEVKKSSQSGEKVYYSIRMLTSDGKKITLVNDIEGRHDAEAVAEHMKKAIADS